MHIAASSPTAKSTLIKSLSYVVIVGGLSLALAQGARWLVSAEPGATPVAYRPPLPPRIADSIERKKELPPPPPPVVAAKPFVAQPVMQQAAVSLHARQQEIRENQIHELRAQKPARQRAPRPPHLDAQAPADVPAAAPIQVQAVVTTARSDVPY